MNNWRIGPNIAQLVLSELSRLIVPEASAVRCAQAGDVVIMKGQNHRHGLGAVHRSPPIEGLSASRVVLVVSTID